MLADQSLYLHKPSADEAYSPHMCIKTNYFMVQFPGQNPSTITFHHYKSLHVAVQQLHIQGVLWKSSWIQLIACAYVYMEMNYFMVQFPGQNSSTITSHLNKPLHVAIQQQLHIQGVLWKSSWIQPITCAYVYMKINYFMVQFPGPRVVQTQSLDLANHQWV